MTDVEIQVNSTAEEANKRRTRYTGPVNLEEIGEEEIDTTTTGLGRGRPSVDLTPYEKVLKVNFKQNVNLPPEKKVAKVYRVNSDAVGTVKSRFATAAANVKVGITWSQVDHGDGWSTLKLVAGKRLEGRGRKAGHNGQQ